MTSLLLSNIIFSQSLVVGEWSPCIYMNNSYIKYRNISIFSNNTLILSTFENINNYKDLFFIVEDCINDDTPVVAILFCSFIIFCCLIGCYFSTRCPQPKINPL